MNCKIHSDSFKIHSVWKSPKMSHLFGFWHFPPILVELKLTCLVTLFDRKVSGFQKLAKLNHFLAFLMNFCPLKWKRSSLRSQCWMRLFLWFSNTVCPFRTIFVQHFRCIFNLGIRWHRVGILLRLHSLHVCFCHLDHSLVHFTLPFLLYLLLLLFWRFVRSRQHFWWTFSQGRCLK